MAPVDPSYRRRRLVAALAARTLAAAAVWWILVEGRQDAWHFGAPLALAAALASLALHPPGDRRVRAGALLGAAAWFLRRSLAAGLDIALRALRRRVPLDPGFVTYRTRLPDSASRVLLAGALSLLPGTLCAEVEGESLLLHVLDRGADFERDVREMEGRIAASLGIALGAS